MDRRLEWIMRKGAFAVALYFAMVGQVPWLEYAIVAFAWWTLAASVWSIPEGPVASAIAPVTALSAVATAFDLAVLASMFIAHWYWTAFAYAASCGCLALAQARATGKL
jgi:hypothetical protein